MKKYFLFLLFVIILSTTGCGKKIDETYTAEIINNEVFIHLNTNPTSPFGPFVKNGQDKNKYTYKDNDGTHTLIIKSKCLGEYTYDYIMMAAESVNTCDLPK